MPARLARRTVLRGIHRGVSLGLSLPLLEAMRPRHAHAAAVRRYATFFWSLGMEPGAWVPKATGPTWDLPDQLSAFAPLKHKLSLVTGTKINSPRNSAHISGIAGIMSGDDMDFGDHLSASFKRASFDHHIAGHIGTTTRLRSLEVRASHWWQHTTKGTAINHPSHRGAAAPNKAELDPRVVWSRLFGAEMPAPSPGSSVDTAAIEREAQSQKSILDAVLQDAQRLRSRVGDNDRKRIDLHLESLRSLEKRIMGSAPVAPAIAGVACDAGGAPAQPRVEEIRSRTKIMSELIAMAFACDLTRVATFAFSAGGSHQTWPEMNLNMDMHEAGHRSQFTPQLMGLIKYWMENFATFAKTLDAIPEGDGTLLDSCLVLGTSECSGAPSHRIDEFPLILLGGANKTFKTGVHVRKPGGQATAIPFTIMKAFGVPIDAWGTGGMTTTEVVSEILV